MHRTLRVGIIGLGAVARVHLQAYQTVPNVRIAGVADIDQQRLHWAREHLGALACATVEELLKTVELDVCCVLTPPAAHESAVLACAQGGVHVLCEKPLALSVESCERMIEQCRASGVRLCYGASYRYLPAIVVAREMILSGALGEILLCREYAVGGKGPACRQTLGPSHYPIGGPGGSGMGLCDHGIHLIDAFAWMMDSRVVEVTGRGNRTGEPPRPEHVQMVYANGACAQLLYEDGTFSSDLPGEGMFAWGGGWGAGGATEATSVGAQWEPHPGSIHIHGTKGSLRIMYYANALFHRDAQGVRQVRIPDRPMPANFSMQLQAFVQAILDDRETPVPGEAGLDACRTLLGIYAGTGQPLASRLRPS